MTELITVTRGYRYRIIPTEDQEVLINKTIGCCRKLWNQRLEDVTKSTPIYKTARQYKQDFPFMVEVDAHALQAVEKFQTQAFKNFRKNPNHFGFPKFKSKHTSTQSYTTCNCNNSIRLLDSQHINLPKLGKVKIKLYKQLPKNCKITYTTISKEPNGKYYISLTCTWEELRESVELDKSKSLGLDYSLPHFYVDSQGMEADYPHFFYKYQEKLAYEQKKLSKMQRGSKRYQKQRLRIAKLQSHISNSRKDFLHKLSKQLADQCDYIFVEDIDMQAQAQHHNHGKKTNDNGFGMFRNFLAYKLKYRGKVFLKIDRWLPSSKTCRHCGVVNKDLKEGEMEWTCPSCGAYIDRDLNAAINILNCGLSMI